MRSENLEARVREALKAYYREGGMSEEQATVSTEKRIIEACLLVRAKVGEPPQVRTREAMEDITSRFSGAFAALKAWSAQNV
jgi:hypothetical protein